MLDRIVCKSIAKKQLQGRWLTPVLATLIFLAIVTALSCKIPIIAICSVAVLNIAYIYLFVVLSHTKDKSSLSTFIQGFSLWLNGILGMLWYILWVSIWSFVFVIPGIVKMYSYSQIFFIIAENPDMDVRKAMNLSKKITNGSKMDLFVFDLSFMGWFLLSAITGGILLLWVIPYYYMAKTNVFHSIKQNAINAGIVDSNEFVPNTMTDSPKAEETKSAQHVWNTEDAEDAQTVQTNDEDPILLGDNTSISDNPNNEEGNL